MEAFLLEYAPKIKFILELLGSLVVIATVIVRITPSPKDDKIVSTISGFILKILKYAPTIGINPNTKKLEKAQAELEK